MKRIAIVTATRAEYGLLSPAIRELRKRENDELRVDLIVTGTHLSEKYGMTIDEIKEELEKQGVKIKKDSDLEDVVQNSIDSVWGDEARFENNPRYVQHSAVDNEYEKEIEAEENSNTVNKLLRGLDERSAEIIKMLFGIGYDSPMDIEAVAERMNLTTTRIGQIRNAALKKMKTYAETA